jgi:hypothetical protein
MREDGRAGNLQCSALLLKDFGQRNMRTGRKDSGQSISETHGEPGCFPCFRGRFRPLWRVFLGLAFTPDATAATTPI